LGGILFEEDTKNIVIYITVNQTIRNV